MENVHLNHPLQYFFESSRPQEPISPSCTLKEPHNSHLFELKLLAHLKKNRRPMTAEQADIRQAKVFEGTGMSITKANQSVSPGAHPAESR